MELFYSLQMHFTMNLVKPTWHLYAMYRQACMQIDVKPCNASKILSRYAGADHLTFLPIWCSCSSQSRFHFYDLQLHDFERPPNPRYQRHLTHLTANWKSIRHTQSCGASQKKKFIQTHAPHATMSVSTTVQQLQQIRAMQLNDGQFWSNCGT